MADDYKVGYRRPPLETRFRKGQSGNPEGRAKGGKNLRTDLAEELSTPITITVNGKRRKISKQRAVLTALVNDSIKSDQRATALLLKLALQLLESAAQPEPAQKTEQLSATEREILTRFIE